MKKILLSVLVAAAFFVMGQVSQAQTTKVGHISTVEVITRMPEYDSAMKIMQDYGKELEDNIMAMQTEYQNKALEYQKNKALEYQNNQSQWSDLIKQTKQRELQDMEVRLQEFAQQSQEDYTRKQQEVISPITDKVTKAIETVAQEGKFAYILDSSNGTVFIGPDAIDVMPLVSAKLGLKLTSSIPVSGN